MPNNIIDAYHSRCGEIYYASRFVAARDRVSISSVLLRTEFELALPIVREIERLRGEIVDCVMQASGHGDPGVLDALRAEMVRQQNELAGTLHVPVSATQGVAA